MFDRISLTGLVLTSAGTAGLATAQTATPYEVWAPLMCGCLAALIVRGIAITTPSRKKRVMVFEVLVTLLSVLLTGAIIFDRQYTIMYATFAGMGIGALGVGVIGMARTWAKTMLQNIAKSYLAASDPKKLDP
ncbi:hypothetical protein [Sphingomonas sp. M1A8_2b]